MKWPNTKETSAHMAMRQQQNLASCMNSAAKSWMNQMLKNRTVEKWTRQARWGWRLYDFWCHRLGIGIEVDGPEHSRERDSQKDREDFERSGILIIRVRNFNESDLEAALAIVHTSQSWNARRAELGKAAIKNAE